jgi:hypothetical protein
VPPSFSPVVEKSRNLVSYLDLLQELGELGSASGEPSTMHPILRGHPGHRNLQSLSHQTFLHMTCDQSKSHAVPRHDWEQLAGWGLPRKKRSRGAGAALRGRVQAIFTCLMPPPLPPPSSSRGRGAAHCRCEGDYRSGIDRHTLCFTSQVSILMGIREKSHEQLAH